MPDQSRELNMLACLLFALASGSFARFHCDVFLFFSTRCFPLFFLHDVFPFFWLQAARFVFTLTATEVLHRHVNERRLNGRRLSASRDIGSIRVAITVPCQYHQYRSLVSLIRAIVELSRYDAIIYIFAEPASICPFGFRNSYCFLA